MYFQHLLRLMCFINISISANILIMIPMPFYSHSKNYIPIYTELARRGHNVTVVSPYPQISGLPNLTHIVVADLQQELKSTLVNWNVLDMDGIIFQMIGLWIFGLMFLPKALKTEQVQRLIQDTHSTFDLIMTETWFTQEPLVAFGHKFNAPVINFMPAFIFPHSAHLTGNDFPLSYLPTSKLAFNDRMTFMERLLNSFLFYWDVILGEAYYLKKQDAIMRQYFNYPGSETLPPLVEMLKNTSLTLMDHNFAIGYPLPLHQNIVLYGGLYQNTTDKLTPDLQNFMDTAKEGVIYLSFGTYCNMSMLNAPVQHAIFSTLVKMKQKVIIKLEDHSLLNYSTKNILAKSWLPQVSILAHPNLKLFISHGGIHGIMEAIYYAVPLLVIPLFFDQRYNARFIETVGIGYKIDISNLTVENLQYAIDLVLSNSKFKENIMKRSAIFKDQPISTLDNVIYWIEYVIRHKGAAHLRPAVLDLHWYQYLLVDVVVFYLLITLPLIYFLKTILITFFNYAKCRCWRKKAKIV